MALRGTRQMVEVLGANNTNATRVTRQSVAVLANSLGKLRVYRQMIEVLCGETEAQVYEESLTSTLSLTQTLHCSLIQVSATSTLSATSTAVKELTKQRFAESIIELTQDCDQKSEAFSVITITDEVAVLRIANKVATSALSAAQTLAYDAIFNRLATSPLTVTQEAIYHGPIAASATNTISLTGSARKCDTFLASALSTLIATDAVAAAGTIRVSASSALMLMSTADRGIFNRAAISDLVLSDSASPDYYYQAVSVIELTSTAIQGQVFGNAVSVIELTQVARPNPLTAGPGPEYDFYLPATTIELTQVVTSSIHMLTAQSPITLSDVLGVKRPWYAQATTLLQTITHSFDPITFMPVDILTGLQDAVSVTKRVGAPYLVGHYLQLTDSVAVVKIKPTALSASATTSLSVAQAAYRTRTGAAITLIQLLSIAAGNMCVPVPSVLAMTDAATFNITRSRQGISAMDLVSSLSGMFVHIEEAVDDSIYIYCPVIGQGSPTAPTPPPGTLNGPLSGVVEPFRLIYPSTGSITDSVTIRRPNFGNKDRLGFNRVLRETRGGTLIVYADPIWPKTQTLVLSFSGLKPSEKDEVLEFLDAYLGLEIGLLDWEHRYWRGIVIAPDQPAVQDDRNSFTVSFEFEGVMDPSWTP